MAKSADKADAESVMQDLQEAILDLTKRLEVVTQAIDQVFEELQWRNNEMAGRREEDCGTRTPPAGCDGSTNDGRDSGIRAGEQMGSDVAASAENAAGTPRSVDQLRHEVADVRQCLAAFILAVSDEHCEEVPDAEGWLVEWACQAYDADAFVHAMRDVAVEDLDGKSPRERQATLFSEDEATET